MKTPLFLEDLPCGGLFTTETGLCMGANEEFRRVTGWTEGDLRGAQIDMVLSGGARIFCQTHLWPMLLKTGRIQEVYFHLLHRDGRRVPAYSNAKIVEHEGSRRVLWLFFAADERRQFEAELIALRRSAEESAELLSDAHERLRILNAQLQVQVSLTAQKNHHLEQEALTDSLTQLGNRRSLQSCAIKLASARHFSVLMIDADHFKQVNDKYGHARGDEVLKDIAACLTKSARQNDTVVRYGGEEFAVVLPNSGRDEAMVVAKRIHGSIAECHPGGLAVTVSIGTATSDQGQDDLYVMLKFADEALYQAKSEGRNRTVAYQANSATG